MKNKVILLIFFIFFSLVETANANFIEVNSKEGIIEVSKWVEEDNILNNRLYVNLTPELNIKKISNPTNIFANPYPYFL